ncbi:MAG: sugar phosphate nucleotidyltransferase, partial [Candidatus Omnitrophica bacterium]|nr:sugar phosphate nucleotidyltransferase [Candidatus Omnitrophota bacterium]
ESKPARGKETLGNVTVQVPAGSHRITEYDKNGNILVVKIVGPDGKTIAEEIAGQGVTRYRYEGDKLYTYPAGSEFYFEASYTNGQAGDSIAKYDADDNLVETYTYSPDRTQVFTHPAEGQLDYGTYYAAPYDAANKNAGANTAKYNADGSLVETYEVEDDRLFTSPTEGQPNFGYYFEAPYINGQAGDSVAKYDAADDNLVETYTYSPDKTKVLSHPQTGADKGNYYEAPYDAANKKAGKNTAKYNADGTLIENYDYEGDKMFTRPAEGQENYGYRFEAPYINGQGSDSRAKYTADGKTQVEQYDYSNDMTEVYAIPSEGQPGYGSYYAAPYDAEYKRAGANYGRFRVADDSAIEYYEYEGQSMSIYPAEGQEDWGYYYEAPYINGKGGDSAAKYDLEGNEVETYTYSQDKTRIFTTPSQGQPDYGYYYEAPYDAKNKKAGDNVAKYNVATGKKVEDEEIVSGSQTLSNVTESNVPDRSVKITELAEPNKPATVKIVTPGKNGRSLIEHNLAEKRVKKYKYTPLEGSYTAPNKEVINNIPKGTVIVQTQVYNEEGQLLGEECGESLSFPDAELNRIKAQAEATLGRTFDLKNDEDRNQLNTFYQYMLSIGGLTSEDNSAPAGSNSPAPEKPGDANSAPQASAAYGTHPRFMLFDMALRLAVIDNNSNVQARADGFYVGGKKLDFMVGVSCRGREYGWNFGNDNTGFAVNKDELEKMLAQMNAVGIEKIRMNLLDDARNLRKGYDAYKQDIKEFLDACARHNIRVEFVLFDFLAVARGNFNMTAREVTNFISNFLTPFLAEFGNHSALMAIDLINEPEWILDKSVAGGWGDKMEGGRKPVTAANYYNFVAKVGEAIKSQTNGRILRTIGASIKEQHMPVVTYPRVAPYLDYYAFHWYPFMNRDGQHGLDYCIARIPQGKPWVLEEFATAKADMTVTEYLNKAKTSKASGADAWNWSVGIDEYSSNSPSWHEEVKKFKGTAGVSSAVGPAQPGQPNNTQVAIPPAQAPPVQQKAPDQATPVTPSPTTPPVAQLTSGQAQSPVPTQAQLTQTAKAATPKDKETLQRHMELVRLIREKIYPQYDAILKRKVVKPEELKLARLLQWPIRVLAKYAGINPTEVTTEKEKEILKVVTPKELVDKFVPDNILANLPLCEAFFGELWHNGTDRKISYTDKHELGIFLYWLEELNHPQYELKTIFTRALRLRAIIIERYNHDLPAQNKINLANAFDPAMPWGETLTGLLIYYAVENTRTEWILNNPAERLAIMSSAFEEPEYKKTETSVINNIDQDLTARATAVINSVPRSQVNLESYLRDIIYALADSLVKGVRAGDIDAKRAAIYQRVIAAYLNVHQKAAYHELVELRSAPQEYIGIRRALISGVLAKLEVESLTTLSDILFDGTVTPLNNYRQGANVTALDAKRQIEMSKTNRIVFIDFGSPIDLYNSAFVMSIRPSNGGSGTVRITALDAADNSLGFDMQIGGSGRAWHQMPGYTKDEKVYYVFFTFDPDYRYARKGNFGGQGVKTIKIEYLSGDDSLLIKNPYVRTINQQQANDSTASLKLNNNSRASLVEVAKTSRFEQKADTEEHAMYYFAGANKQPVNLNGATLKIEGGLPESAEPNQTVIVTLIDINGNMQTAQTTARGGKFVLDINNVRSSADFNAKAVVFIESRFSLVSYPAEVNSELMTIEVVLCALVGVVVWISARRRAYKQYKEYNRTIARSGQKPYSYRQFMKRARRSALTITPPVAPTPRTAKTEPADAPQPEEMCIGRLQAGINEYAKVLRDWQDDMGIDYRYMGIQHEDKGIFLPFMRKTEGWFFFDDNAAARYPLHGIWNKDVMLVALMGLLYYAGYDGLLAWLFPVFALFVIAGSFNPWVTFPFFTGGSAAIFALHQMLPSVNHTVLSMLFVVAILIICRIIPAIRYIWAIRAPEKYINQQAKKLRQLHSILRVMRSGDMTLAKVLVNEVPDSNDKITKDDIMALANISYLSDDARAYLEFRAKWLGGGKSKLTKTKFKERLLPIALGEIFFYVQDVRRWRRSHAIGEGYNLPGGAVEQFEPFGVTLDRAIQETQDLETCAGQAVRHSPLYPAAHIGLPVLVSALAGLAFWGFVIHSPVTALIISGTVLVIGLLFAARIAENSARREMLIDPAKGRKKIAVENFRILYNSKQGAQNQGHDLIALDVFRSSIEIFTAATSGSQDIAVALAPGGRVDDIPCIIQRELDGQRDGMVNTADSAISRGFLDSLHLSKNEAILAKVMPILKAIALAVIFSLAVYIITVIAFFMLGEISALISTGHLLSWNMVFRRPFAILEIVKGLASGVAFTNLLHWLPFALGQTILSSIAVAGVALTLVKFAFGFMGMYAKYHPEESSRVIVPAIIFSILFILSAAGFVCIPPVPSGLNLLARLTLEFFAVFSAGMLVCAFIGRNRFKGIMVDNLLLEENSKKTRNVKLSDRRWDELRRQSFDMFAQTVHDRYDDTEMDVILEANRNGKDNFADDAALSAHAKRMLYDRILGKGSMPSGTQYRDGSIPAICEAYEQLIASGNTDEVIQRMSGLGFSELKDFMADNLGRSLPPEMELWHAQAAPGSVSLSSDELRGFLDSHPLEKRLIKMYDFLPKFTPWIVVVGGEDEVKKLIRILKEGYRYPLHKLTFIFAGENWDMEAQTYIRDEKDAGRLPAQLQFRGMPIREDNLNEADIQSWSWAERRNRIFNWVSASFPYTKPGANTASLTASDGTCGIIYDAENVPQHNQPLQVVLGTMMGVTANRRLTENRFRPALRRVLGMGFVNRIFAEVFPSVFMVGTLGEETVHNITLFGGILLLIAGLLGWLTQKQLVAAIIIWAVFFIIKLICALINLQLPVSPAIAHRLAKSYARNLRPEDRRDQFRFNFKRGRVLERHLRYFIRRTLPTIIEFLNDNHNRQLLSPALLFRHIRNLARSGRSTVRDTEIRRLINCFITISNMPGYGLLATNMLTGRITACDFIEGLFVGEFRRINEPKNGQGRLAKITNALNSARPNKEIGSQGQAAAFMYAEYASWYDAIWDGFHAAGDTFKPLGGTTGYFCTEAPEELDWQDQALVTALNLQSQDTETMCHHYDVKNKLLTLGAWDEFQVAEDYMLGLVSWWYGFNIAGFYSVTPENPEGFEAELGFKFRPKQMSRWNKGYIIGHLVVSENVRNALELYERKGLWGYLVFLVPTLCSSIHPLIFSIMRFITQLWWLYFLLKPVKALMSFLFNHTGVAVLLRKFIEITQLTELSTQIREIVGGFIPDCLSFMPSDLAGAIGPALVYLPLVLYIFLTLFGIFHGVDNRLGVKRILEECSRAIEVAETKCRDEIKPAEQAAYNDTVINALRERREIIARGDFPRVFRLRDRNSEVALLSPYKWYLGASMILGASIAIIATPSARSLMTTFIFGLVSTLILGLAVFGAIIVIGYLYIRLAPDLQERQIHAMAFRCGGPALFIPLYHMLYIDGNSIAWEEVLNGGYLGFWWRTPRSAKMLEEVERRLLRKAWSQNDEDKKIRAIGEQLFGSKDKHISSYRAIEKELEHTRLWMKLICNWGFYITMLLMVSLGIRMDIRTYLYSKQMALAITGEQASAMPILEVIKNYPFLKIILGAVLIILALYILTILASRVINWLRHGNFSLRRRQDPILTELRMALSPEANAPPAYHAERAGSMVDVSFDINVPAERREAVRRTLVRDIRRGRLVIRLDNQVVPADNINIRFDSIHFEINLPGIFKTFQISYRGVTTPGTAVEQKVIKAEPPAPKITLTARQEQLKEIIEQRNAPVDISEATVIVNLKSGPHDKKVSKGTVARDLKFLADTGLVKKEQTGQKGKQKNWYSRGTDSAKPRPGFTPGQVVEEATELVSSGKVDGADWRTLDINDPMVADLLRYYYATYQYMKARRLRSVVKAGHLRAGPMTSAYGANVTIGKSLWYLIASNDNLNPAAVLEHENNQSTHEKNLVAELAFLFYSWRQLTPDQTDAFAAACTTFRSFAQEYPVWVKPWIEEAKTIARLGARSKINIDTITQESLNVTCPREKRIGVIMAGGEGTRFFPKGRSTTPKQFVDIFPGGKKLIQLAIERLLDPAGPGTIVIQTNVKFSQLVRDAAKDYEEYKQGKILVYGEPSYADNTAALYYAISKIEKAFGRDVVVEMYPADHIVPETDFPDYHGSIQRLANLALTQPYLGVVGIRPTRDETGFGHHKVKQALPIERLFASAFTEKPDQVTIDGWKQAGEYSLTDDKANKYYWNAGYFIASVSTWFNALEDVAGDTVAITGKANRKNNFWQLFVKFRAAVKTEEEDRVAKEIFDVMAAWKKAKDPASIDHIVAEPVADENTLRVGMLMSMARFSWDDVGSFSALRELYQQKYADHIDKDGNLTTLGESSFTDCHQVSVIGDGIIKVEAKGLTDVIIILDGDVVTVVQGHKNDQKVKELHGIISKDDKLKHYAEKKAEAIVLATLTATSDQDGNTLTGETIALSCKDSTLYAERGLVTGYGLNNITVTRRGDRVTVSADTHNPAEGTHAITAQTQRDAPALFPDIAGDLKDEFIQLGDDIEAIVTYLRDNGFLKDSNIGDPKDFALARHAHGRMYWANGLKGITQRGKEATVRAAIQALGWKSLGGALNLDEETIIAQIKAHESQAEEKDAIAAQAKAFARENYPVGFGTSGIRDNAKKLTDRASFALAKGFYDYMLVKGFIKAGDAMLIGGDLRPSTDRIMDACLRGVAAAGGIPWDAGKVPTPAVAEYARIKSIASLMVTASHNPEKENGIKPYLPGEEVLKGDEKAILDYVTTAYNEYKHLFDNKGRFLEKEPLRDVPGYQCLFAEVKETYINRFLNAFPAGCLAGMRIGFWEHTSVGRDIDAEILERLGAQVFRFKRARRFVAIDTEAVPEKVRKMLKKFVLDNQLDALVFCDGDADRPGLVTDLGEYITGDILNIETTKFLKLDYVAVPASRNDEVDAEMARCGIYLQDSKIGSPFCIDWMNKAQAEGAYRDAWTKAAGKSAKSTTTAGSWECNGGFLLRTAVSIPGGSTMEELPTRDAMIALLAPLVSARQQGKKVSELYAAYKRKTSASKLKSFPTVFTARIMKLLIPVNKSVLAVNYIDDLALIQEGITERWVKFSELGTADIQNFAQINATLKPYFDAEGFSRIAQIRYRDGVRIIFEGEARDRDIAHLRASSNSPEFRTYANAATQERADQIVKICLEKIIPAIVFSRIVESDLNSRDAAVTDQAHARGNVIDLITSKLKIVQFATAKGIITMAREAEQIELKFAQDLVINYPYRPEAKKEVMTLKDYFGFRAKVAEQLRQARATGTDRAKSRPGFTEAQHPFAPLSRYAKYMMGGGVDWVIFFGIISALMLTCGPWVIASASSYLFAGIWCVAGTICPIIFVTTLARVSLSIHAIHRTHSGLSFRKVLRYDIGHDWVALDRLKRHSPYIYRQIINHEAFASHIRGLLAFIPGAMPIRNIFVRQLMVQGPPKKVLLIASPTYNETSKEKGYLLSPPCGLYRLKAYLEGQNIASVDIYDPNLNHYVVKDRVRQLIALGHYDIVGFSLTNINMQEQEELMECVIDAAKQESLPVPMLVGGGVEATHNYREWLGSSKLDYIVLGHGERPLETIINYMPADWRERAKDSWTGNIAGIAFRTRDGREIIHDARPLSKEDFKSFAFTCDPYKDIPYESYWNFNRGIFEPDVLQIAGRTLRTINIFTSANPFFASRRYRSSPLLYLCAYDVFELMQRNSVRYQPEAIAFDDPDFVINRKLKTNTRQRIIKLCTLINEAKQEARLPADLKCYAQTRATNITYRHTTSETHHWFVHDAELLRVMKDAGFVMLGLNMGLSLPDVHKGKVHKSREMLAVNGIKQAGIAPNVRAPILLAGDTEDAVFARVDILLGLARRGTQLELYPCAREMSSGVGIQDSGIAPVSDETVTRLEKKRVAILGEIRQWPGWRFKYPPQIIGGLIYLMAVCKNYSGGTRPGDWRAKSEEIKSAIIDIVKPQAAITTTGILRYPRLVHLVEQARSLMSDPEMNKDKAFNLVNIAREIKTMQPQVAAHIVVYLSAFLERIIDNPQSFEQNREAVICAASGLAAIDMASRRTERSLALLNLLFGVSTPVLADYYVGQETSVSFIPRNPIQPSNIATEFSGKNVMVFEGHHKDACIFLGSALETGILPNAERTTLVTMINDPEGVQDSFAEAYAQQYGITLSSDDKKRANRLLEIKRRIRHYEGQAFASALELEEEDYIDLTGCAELKVKAGGKKGRLRSFYSDFAEPNRQLESAIRKAMSEKRPEALVIPCPKVSYHQNYRDLSRILIRVICAYNAERAREGLSPAALYFYVPNIDNNGFSAYGIEPNCVNFFSQQGEDRKRELLGYYSSQLDRRSDYPEMMASLDAENASVALAGRAATADTAFAETLLKVTIGASDLLERQKMM